MSGNWIVGCIEYSVNTSLMIGTQPRHPCLVVQLGGTSFLKIRASPLMKLPQPSHPCLVVQLGGTSFLKIRASLQIIDSSLLHHGVFSVLCECFHRNVQLILQSVLISVKIAENLIFLFRVVFSPLYSNLYFNH